MVHRMHVLLFSNIQFQGSPCLLTALVNVRISFNNHFSLLEHSSHTLTALACYQMIALVSLTTGSVVVFPEDDKMISLNPNFYCFISYLQFTPWPPHFQEGEPTGKQSIKLIDKANKTFSNSLVGTWLEILKLIY